MSSPKYIRVHLDRFGADTEDYNLWYCLGMMYPDFSNPLFPNITTDIQHPYYPRKALRLGYEGYVHIQFDIAKDGTCLLYTSPSPRDLSTARMPASA